MPDKPLSSFEEKPPLSAFEISPDEPSDPNLLSEAVAQKRAEAVTGAKKGIIGGLGFPGDVTKFIGTKLGLQDKDRALPTSEEVSQGAEYLSKRVPAGLAPYLTPPKPEEPSEKTVEFLANPFSWIGPGGFGTKLLSALGAGVGGGRETSSRFGSALHATATFTATTKCQAFAHFSTWIWTPQAWSDCS